jgi:hypothetical protein
MINKLMLHSLLFIVLKVSMPHECIICVNHRSLVGISIGLEWERVAMGCDFDVPLDKIYETMHEHKSLSSHM